jgi:beta-glucosidase
MFFEKRVTAALLVVSVAILSKTCIWAQAQADKPIYLYQTQPIDKRVEDLLKRMTLEEKIGQINMPVLYKGELGKDIQSKRENCRRFAEGVFVEGIGPGGGFFTLANSILPEGPRQQAEFHNELQRTAAEKTRLKIPLIQIEEGTHGLMAAGGTIFPEGLAKGSNWNTDLVRAIYAAAAKEARAVGIHILCTLVVEPGDFTIMIGSSSVDIRLSGTFDVKD